MILDEIVLWYQKKIGTYDKEPWEKTVEQKILDGFTSVSLKTAKLKTELIDVDLVRGSTFPKAKPKQSLLTVIRLASLRYFLLPLYAQWWVKQTSTRCFGLLLILYVTQMINWAVYSYNVNRLERSNDQVIINKTNSTQLPKSTNDDTAQSASETEYIVSISELFIPMVLGFFLSLIHSQIVATNIAQSSSKCKRRRYSNTSQNDRHGKDIKLRRRKKLVKSRNHELLENATTKLISIKKYGNEGSEPLPKKGLEMCSKTPTNFISSHTDQNPSCPQSSAVFSLSSSSIKSQTVKNKLELELVDVTYKTTHTENVPIDTDNDSLTRKRNVNWHSPIHKFASSTTTTQEKQQQTTPQSISTTSSTHTSHVGENSSISSGSTSVSPIKCVRIDDCVQEFYDDLISRTIPPPPARGASDQQETGRLARRTVGEDDGFESLNGKSSSGEDTNPSLHVAKNQLRLRLNTLDNRRVHNEPLAQSNFRRMGFFPTADNEDLKTTKQMKVIGQSHNMSSEETDEEGDDNDLISSPASQVNVSNYNECTTSATEWLGITTNSDDCSYSSEYDNSDNYKSNQYSDENGCDLDFTPTTILNPHGTSDRTVFCL